MNVNELRLYKDGYIRGIEEMITALEVDYIACPIGDENVLEIKISNLEKAKLIGCAMSAFNYDLVEMIDDELYDLPDFNFENYYITMDDLPEYLKDILKEADDEI